MYREWIICVSALLAILLILLFSVEPIYRLVIRKSTQEKNSVESIHAQFNNQNAGSFGSSKGQLVNDSDRILESSIILISNFNDLEYSEDVSNNITLKPNKSSMNDAILSVLSVKNISLLSDKDIKEVNQYFDPSSMFISSSSITTEATKAQYISNVLKNHYMPLKSTDMVKELKKRPLSEGSINILNPTIKSSANEISEHAVLMTEPYASDRELRPTKIMTNDKELKTMEDDEAAKVSFRKNTSLYKKQDQNSTFILANQSLSTTANFTIMKATTIDYRREEDMGNILNLPSTAITIQPSMVPNKQFVNELETTTSTISNSIANQMKENRIKNVFVHKIETNETFLKHKITLTTPANKQNLENTITTHRHRHHHHHHHHQYYDSKSAIIVTALFDIGRGKWPKYTRTYGQYLRFLANLLTLQNRLVIYTDKRGAEFVRQRREIKNTHIFEMNTQNLPLYRYRNEMENIIRHEQEVWQFDPKTKDHPEAKSADYDIVVNSKPYFLYNATQSSKFRAGNGIFTWIDAGYGHGRKSVIPLHCHWRPQLRRDRITIIKLTPIHDKILRYSVNNLYRVDWVVLSGGFIAGDSVIINRFYRFYLKTLLDFLDSGRIDDDQTILTLTLKNYENLFDIVHSNGDWFAIFRLFPCS